MGCLSGTNVMYQGLGGIATPLVPLSQLSQGTILIQNAPLNGATIETDVTVANTETNDFITRVTNQVHAEVEIVGNHVRSTKLHHLDFLPEDSGNHEDNCGSGEHESL